MIGLQGLYKHKHGFWHSTNIAAVEEKRYKWTGVKRQLKKKSLTLMHSLLDLRSYITVVSSQIILSTKRVTLYYAQVDVCMISGLCHEVDEIWTLLGYYAAYNGNSLPTFRVNLSVPSSRDETDRLPRNVRKELLLYAALYPRTAQISC